MLWIGLRPVSYIWLQKCSVECRQNTNVRIYLYAVYRYIWGLWCLNTIWGYYIQIFGYSVSVYYIPGVCSV